MSRDWSRYEAVWEYRRQRKTYKEIAELIGRSSVRVDQMIYFYRRHQMRPNNWQHLNYDERMDVLTNCGRRRPEDWMEEYALKGIGMTKEEEPPSTFSYKNPHKPWLRTKLDFEGVLKKQLSNA